MVTLNDIVAHTPAMVQALHLCRVYAPALTPVVLVGATGTGKTFFAQVIHALSGRRGPFVDATAGELSGSLSRSHLFGHERGAFTGAVRRRAGLFVQGAGGTLLLDDFHLLSRSAQAALLRALDRGLYRPVGADRDLSVQARLLVGLREDPDALVASGAMLPDLRWRLQCCVVRLPTLEERREEIGEYAHRFLQRCPAETGVRGPTTFAPGVIAVLRDASWPGNLRQLQGEVRAAYLDAQGSPELGVEHLPQRLQSPPRFVRGGDATQNRRAILSALTRTAGRKDLAARLAGVHRNTVARYAAEPESRHAR